MEFRVCNFLLGMFLNASLLLRYDIAVCRTLKYGQNIGKYSILQLPTLFITGDRAFHIQRV